MSTKTTFKRIALVTVAALGFGVLTSVSPASAAYTGGTGITLSDSSITVVGGNNNGTTDTPSALVRVNASSNDGSGLAAETITVKVTNVPTTVAAKTLATDGGITSNNDLVITETGGQTENSATNWTVFTACTPSSSESATDGIISARNNNASCSFAGMDGTDTAAATKTTEAYYFAITPKNGEAVIDYGVYTLSVTYTDANGTVIGTPQTLKIDFVSTPALSGAVLSAISTKGNFTTGETVTYTTTKYATVTLTNRDGGKVRKFDGNTPTLSTSMYDNATTPVLLSAGTNAKATNDIGAYDAGTADDYLGVVATADLRNKNNGVYGLAWGASISGMTSTVTIYAKYGAASTSAALTIYAAGTGTSASSATATGTGLLAGATSGTWTAPLTTKSVVVTATLLNGANPIAEYPLTFTTVWTAAAGDVTPVSGSTGAQTVKTDAAGKASITLTYATPIDAKSATVSIAGGGVTWTDQVITWTKAKPYAFVVGSTYMSSALKGSNKITYTLVDAFGQPVAGEVVTLALTGANNALGTVTIPSATTDANGQVSYTVTDAAALTTESDYLAATSTTVSTVTKSVRIYYLTTLPVIGAMKGYYALDEYAAFSGTLVPSTVVSASNPLNINQARDLTKSLTASAAVEDQVAIRITATTDVAGTLAAKGVPVTVSVSNGGWLLDDAGKPVTSRVIYSDSSGYVGPVKLTATTPGEKTVTWTAGTVTGSVVVEFENALGDARNITVTAGANNKTATANAAALPSFTATVTDKLGNPVKGATISVIATGVGRLATGGKSAQWTTDATGAYTFELSSSEAGAASVAVSLTTGETANQTADKAGYVGTTVVGDATAGNSSVTATVTFAEGTNAAEANAQAAADAAAEATDAANAATDAANAAAEAADAATAAAQDAADAVAALSTQVSEMVSALKKQITALTNLVIKIQKKVKA